MKLLTTTAAALLIAAPAAFAQEATVDDGMTNDTMQWDSAELIRSRDITGGNVYTTNAADDEGWDAGNLWNEVGADWNQIGEIEDLVLDRSGQIVGIVAEVGGFLDIGDKHVVIEVGDLNLVAVDDATYAYVTRLNEEELENMQDVDEGFWD
ncbi:PRC-barrel domain-containing protein [Roseibacterium sp. SDUM158017]|uniref:PRC-barrel domain-containing protein n=1 Tax=Roseicyclus salinarum TaxID=3036773 RepID=UPI002414D930|nr:PRC-barrel domain-containing protein [Roseibacterium sp. SDUM158017]MDG4647810.1 PRC-barrel domain-containing protein [Roseibacterium sp. SDUM158017]